MNFRQDEEHKDILEMVHEFAVNEVKPLAAEIDRTEEFPMKNVKMMAEMGLMGIPFPEEYGGSGMDTLAYIQTFFDFGLYAVLEKETRNPIDLIRLTTALMKDRAN